MGHVRLLGWSAVVATVLATGACGGGGGGGSTVDTDPIKIDSTALPASLSGQLINHQIPFSGGAGGPYILELLDGDMPDGVNLDGDTVSIVGRLLEDGVFDFRLKLTDTGSQPFGTTVAQFHWEVGIGAVVFGTDPELPVIVYNQFVLVQLVVAGGTPPYACEVVDDPSNPNDGPLPTGLAIPPSSCSIVGAPQQANPGNAPFFVTIRAHDHADIPGFPNPGTATRTFELSVLVPPIIVVTTSMPDGKCGTLYNEKIEISDGVGPFKHELVTDIGEHLQLKGEPGTPDGVAKGQPDSAYAAETSVGPAYPKRFPEGLRLVDGTGEVKGIARRRGTFTDWTYHVQSTALPLDPTQNQWRNFTFSMAEATPPALSLDPSVLAAGSTAFAPPNNKIPELESTKPYSLQFKCLNGVPMDGNYDAPHQSQIVADPAEQPGVYGFVADFGAVGIPDGMSFSDQGLFSGTPTDRSGFRTIALTGTDEQLPTSEALGFPNSVSGAVQYSIGPDTVVIAETLSGTTSTSFDDVAYNFGDQTVEIFEPFSGTPTVRALQAGDMVADHDHPLGGSLAGSLSGIDFLQVSVNPTWWAYDVMNVNAKGARAGQHGDWQKRFRADTVYSDFFRRILGGGGTMPVGGANHSSNLAIELPELAASVATSPASDPPLNGVYRDGGLLHGYDGANEFGFFIIRKDGKIEIPIAFQKPAAGGTYTGFGDGWVTSDRTKPSAIRRPQITVSPDGRFAAVKVKKDIDTFIENASQSAIALFSLTGEKPFDGSSFTIIGTGSGGTSASGGVYLYGDTLTLTNRFLYYLCGDYNGVTNGNVVIYSRHYVYRHEITGGASAGALLSGGAIPATTWSNTTSLPLAMPYHKWMTCGAASVASSSSTGITPYATSYGSTGPNPHFFLYNYANFSENSMAPHPFRVNAAGNAVAMVAAPDNGTNGAGVTSSTNFMKYFLFVDYDAGSGTPILREVGGGTNRRFGTATRLGGYAPGEDTPSFYSSTSVDRLYGWYDGPASQLEISDNGKRVAVVYNEDATAWSTNGSDNETRGRENLICFSGTNASTTDPWSSLSTKAITSGIFNAPTYWRFGCVQFTRDHNGVVFWGGYSNYDGNSGGSTSSRYYMWPGIMSGALYACDVTVGTTTVTSILGSSDGGTNAGVVNYTASTPVSFTSFVNFSGEQGALCPMGAFVSTDGRFYYLRNWCSLNSSDGTYTMNRLVGVNVSAVSGSTINGRTAMRGFAPNWPTRYGVGMEGYYGLYGGMTRWHRGLGGALSLAGEVVSAKNGIVFFTSYNQQYYYADYPYAGYDPNNTTYYYPSGAHPSAYGDYGFLGGQVYGIDANVGGNAVQMPSLGSNTQYRSISYIQPSIDGGRLAIVFNLPTPSPYDSRPHVEQIVNVTGITTSGTGAIAFTGSTGIETSAGRAGPSVAHDFLGTKLYYAFTTSSNENNMLLIEKTLNTAGSAVTNTRTQGGALGGPSGQARFAVLHAGR